jgi:hypothetical protein
MEIFITLLQRLAMVTDNFSDNTNIPAGKSFIPHQGDRIEPVLSFAFTFRHMNVRRFISLAGIKENR